MKKRIFQVMVLLCILVVLLTGILTTNADYRFYLDQSKQELRDVLNLSSLYIKNSTSDYSHAYREISKSIAYDFRMSIISSNGSVLFDSHAHTAQLENHMDRPEVQNAFLVGSGEDVRHSDTLKRDMFYCAVKLDDNTIVRFSRTLSNIYEIFSRTLILFVMIAIGMIILSLILSSRLTNRLIMPIHNATQSLDALLQGATKQQPDTIIYEEFAPFINRIVSLSHSLDAYIGKLRDERDTMDLIINSMNEGLLILNKDQYMLFVNESAKSILACNDMNTEASQHLHILKFTRNKTLLDSISRACEENRHTVFQSSENGRHYRFSVSPVAGQKDSLIGCIVIIMDVTIEKQSEIIRRDFAANVSHELKTPLTTIKGFADMISNGMITNQKDLERYNNMINHEASRLLTLIEDIMRLSEIEETIYTEKDPVNLLSIAQQTARRLADLAQQKQVGINVRGEDVILYANAVNMSELFFNLMENGIKYNKQGGSLNVSVMRKEDYAQIQINDTGIGIPSEHQSRIFERFYRVDKSRSKQTGGTGLGLSIVKHIVERHDGEIRLISEVDKGTCITIKLPLRNA